MVILVVEDEPLLRTSMVRSLNKLQGVEVVDASNVSDAEKLIRTMKPTMLVSDLDLPDGLGTDLLSVLDECDLHIPVLFASAYLDKLSGRIPLRSNIEVREKPLSMEMLRSMVRERVQAVVDATLETPFSVTDYLQLACMGRHSVFLTVRLGAAVLGRIAIYSGEIWAADDDHGAGTDAFRRIVNEATRSGAARTRCETLRGAPGPRTIHDNWQALVLDTVRIFDEESMSLPAVVDDPSDDGISFAAEDEEISFADVNWSGEEPRDREPPPEPPLRPPPEPDKANARAPNPPGNGGREAPEFSRFANDFSHFLEEGLDALLRKDFVAAYRAFHAANTLRPTDASVVANLERLRAMGFGTEEKVT